jgi:signal recognition particle subunit SRP54
MFNSLQDKLDKALHNISGRGKITEINVAETVKEIRRALVDADVNYKVAKDLTKRVQDKALGKRSYFPYSGTIDDENCS